MAAEAVGDGEEGADTMPGGWFVVRSRHDDDPSQLDLDAEEAQLFGRSGWSKVPEHKRGTSALKLHLSDVLSNRIADTFPSLINDIESNLNSAYEQKKAMGEPRDILEAKQKYLQLFVDKYAKQVALALDRPDPESPDQVKLRYRVTGLIKEFDDAMRNYGQSWHFQYPEIQSWHEMQILFECFKTRDTEEYTALCKTFNEQMAQRASPKENSPYKQYDNVSSVDDFLKKIWAYMSELQAPQLYGIINSDIYLIIYSMQVNKWEKIARTHLEQVFKAVQDCYQAILRHLCARDDMRTLHTELEKLLRPIFDKTVEEAIAELKAYCERVLRPHRLQTQNPEWARLVDGWKYIRTYDMLLKHEGTGQSFNELKRDDIARVLHDRHGRHTPEKMVIEVHDHIHVFYNVSSHSCSLLWATAMLTCLGS
jgi:hypothetical protein